MSSAEPSRPRRILCTGIAVLDEVFRVADFARGEVKTRASEFLSVSGGNAANAAFATARLGAPTRFVGPLGGPAGEDPNGDRFLAHFARAGIDCSACPRMPGLATPISAICIDRHGERAIVHYRDARLLQARSINPAAVVADIDVVVADNRFPDFVLPICAAARDRGIPVVLDADEPEYKSIELLKVCSHIIFSAEGLRAIAAVHDLAAALVQVRPLTDAFLAVTDGANDALWLDGATPQNSSVFKVDVVDTLGAGDVFHGAFAVMLAEGQSESHAMRFAAAAAAVKCTRFGGITGAPQRAEIEALLARA
jgi:sugar/nucleoside kinase (ribokinase family)